MNRFQFLLIFLILASVVHAQDFEQDNGNNTFTASNYQQNKNFGRSDSIQGQHKEIPRGLKMWTIDNKFGDRTYVTPDTMSYLFMNTGLTSGLHGEYNTLGNLGSPRINRIFIQRKASSMFPFLDVYDFFNTPISDFRFTSTLSPITNITYNTAGDRTNGEDRFTALFAVNAGRKWGFGFKFDYLYGRGYYTNQNTSHFNYSVWGSYTGDQYQAHLLIALNHQKIAENGGIINDAYITHPEKFNESFSEDEIPVVLSSNWNRNDNQHIFFNHKYSIGFNRKVPMTAEEIEARKFAIRSEQAQKEQEAKEAARQKALKNGEDFDEEEYEEQLQQQRSSGRPANAKIEGNEPKHEAIGGGNRITVNLQDSTARILYPEKEEQTDTLSEWMKNEYVPVTSFIHTLQFDRFRRIYQAYQSPQGYYLNDFYTPQTFTGDSIYDATRSWTLKNTIGIALLEGFNKWAKAGVKVFTSYEMTHYELPMLDNSVGTWNEHNLSVGGQLLKTQGETLHFNASAEAWITGEYSGQLHIDGNTDLNFRLLGDTVQLAANAFFHSDVPSFYFRNYHSRHFWWDNTNLDKTIHTQLAGSFQLKKLGTHLLVSLDNFKNYTYLGQSYDLIEDGTDFLRKHNSVEVRQNGGNISLITLQLQQNLKFLNLIHWDNELTFQQSSNKDVLPVPTFNLYSNLYLRFKIARVLKCDLGTDLRYFSKYYAADYCPQLGQFTIQETPESKVKLGNYPIVNVYANFHLQHTRFFVMYSHVNSHDGGNSFLVPHYPINKRILQFGLSWNFFN